MTARHRRPQGVKAKRPQYTVLIQQSGLELIGLNSDGSELYRVTFARRGPFKSYHAAQSFVSQAVDKDDLWKIEKVTP